LVSDQRFFTHTVIGSGPAGWASLNALIEQGIKPLLIDIGQTSNSPNYFTSPGTKSSSAVAQKTRFGSDHMYTYPAAEDLNFNIEGTVPLSSARGGLSTVWGSNIQGYSWPAQFSDHNIGFENALNAVISQIPTTGCKDTLENVYNWPENFKDRTTLSNRSINIQSRFAKDDTWVLGEARNATLGFRTGCTRCGLCLTGCPENAIFSTESSIRQLINSRTIDYLEAQVTKISNIDGNWKIELLFFNPGQEVHVYSEKVYLGAGAIASSIILSRSELIPENATLDDTQVIYLPFVSFRDRAESQTTFSLAQLFLETKCGMFQENSLHVSIYEHSDSFRDRAANIFPRLAPLLPSFVFKRLMAGIAFLPRNQSGKVGIL
jgi:ferredoxin